MPGRGAIWGARVRGIVIASVLVAALGAASAARATSLSSGFYWKLPAGNGQAYGYAGAIAVSRDGNFVYVADEPANAIEKYSSDGQYLAVTYFKGRQEPTGVATDLSGDVYVVLKATGQVEKLTSKLKVVKTWSVPFAKSIAADRLGHLWVLTTYFNSVGEYNTNGQSIGGFAATQWPGAYFGFPGYDPPSKWLATTITVDQSGDPIIAGESSQYLSDPGPDCHNVIDTPYPNGIDHRPYRNPLVSGEAVRFKPTGQPVDYGWISNSPLDCWHGWQSDGLNPGGISVDPNGGDVYVTSDTELGVTHLSPDLGNSGSSFQFPSAPCNSVDCPAAEWDLIAGGAPTSVAFDCHSNLYVLAGYNARAVVKLFNLGQTPPGSCSTLLQKAAFAPAITLFHGGFHLTGPGKASILVGCHFKPCFGSVTSSMTSFPVRFHLRPGVRKTLTLHLSRRARKLLAKHPGLPIVLVGKVRGGKRTVERSRLRLPAALSAGCTFPTSFDGVASVTGTLHPSHGHERISLEYVAPPSQTALAADVERTVVTDHVGHFTDHYALGQSGRWTVIATSAGDRGHEPANARPCAGTVPKANTQMTISCPAAASAGAPSSFSGALSGAPGETLVAMDYERPDGTLVPHTLSTGTGGSFSDSFTPDQSGIWHALANYNGDANHTPSAGACQFTATAAGPPSSTLTLHCAVTPGTISISCSGQLTSGGAGVPGAGIKLTYQPPSGATATVHNTTTAADGNYHDALTATHGNWQITADYAGDAAHAPASASQSVTVP